VHLLVRKNFFIAKFVTDIEHEDSNTFCIKCCLEGNDCDCGIDTKLRLRATNSMQIDSVFKQCVLHKGKTKLKYCKE
jgi:hypothetical protein